MRHALAAIMIALLCLVPVPKGSAAEAVDLLRGKLASLNRAAPESAAEKSLLVEIGGLLRTLRNRAVPAETDRHMARAEAFFEMAKDPSDYKRAAKELKLALDLAPWLADIYFNLGVIEDKAGLYDSAMRHLRIFLASGPDPADAATAQRLIYKIEARRELTSESQPSDELKSIMEGRYITNRISSEIHELTINGDAFTIRNVGRYLQGSLQRADKGVIYEGTIDKNGNLKGQFVQNQIELWRKDATGRYVTSFTYYGRRIPMTGRVNTANRTITIDRVSHHRTAPNRGGGIVRSHKKILLQRLN